MMNIQPLYDYMIKTSAQVKRYIMMMIWPWCNRWRSCLRSWWWWGSGRWRQWSSGSIPTALGCFLQSWFWLWWRWFMMILMIMIAMRKKYSDLQTGFPRLVNWFGFGFDDKDDNNIIKDKDGSGLGDNDNHRRRQWQAQRCWQSSWGLRGFQYKKHQIHSLSYKKLLKFTCYHKKTFKNSLVIIKNF